jgi:hypothetical protein
MEQLENAYTDGTVQLDTSILMSRPRTSTLNSLKHEFTGSSKKKEDDSLVVPPDRESSPQAFYTKFQNGDEGKPPRNRKEVAQVVILSSGPVSHPGRGTAVQDDCGKDYHWCVGNNAHKPKWVRHEPSSAVDLTIRRSDVAKPASESKEREVRSKTPERQVVLRHARDSRPPRMKTIDGHA